jgi:hypothetical protein
VARTGAMHAAWACDSFCQLHKIAHPNKTFSAGDGSKRYVASSESGISQADAVLFRFDRREGLGLRAFPSVRFSERMSDFCCFRRFCF